MSVETGCVKESEREVASQLDRLSAAIQRSHEIQNAILDLITPILRSEEALEDCPSPGRELTASLAIDLRNLGDTVVAVNREYERIMDRVEL